MSWIDWVPGVTMTSLFAAALWLCREWISARLGRSIQHKFDTKLEELKAKLHEQSAEFSAELRAKEVQMDALRSAALAGVASRRANLDERMISAVDQLWSAVQALAPAKAASADIAIINYDEAARVAETDPRAREVFHTMGGQLDPRELHSHEGQLARPFVSEMSWAIFSAYSSILSVAVLKMRMLSGGINIPNVIDEAKIQRLVLAALPHQKDFVTKHGPQAYHYLLDELEARLLTELRCVLRGVESDKETVEQAGEILRAADALADSLRADENGVADGEQTNREVLRKAAPSEAPHS